MAQKNFSAVRRTLAALERNLFLAIDVPGVEAITGARVLFELRPELSNFQSLGDAHPKAIHLVAEARRRSRG